MTQADLGVPVWREPDGGEDGGDAFWDERETQQFDVSGVNHFGMEPGIWHPTSPADLAAMRERIYVTLCEEFGYEPGMFATSCLPLVADAVMAALFGSSAT